MPNSVKTCWLSWLRDVIRFELPSRRIRFSRMPIGVIDREKYTMRWWTR
jgi:hypothetical protein